jgi:hypothetical protein
MSSWATQWIRGLLEHARGLGVNRCRRLKCLWAMAPDEHLNRCKTDKMRRVQGSSAFYMIRGMSWLV